MSKNIEIIKAENEKPKVEEQYDEGEEEKSSGVY